MLNKMCSTIIFKVLKEILLSTRFNLSVFRSLNFMLDHTIDRPNKIVKFLPFTFKLKNEALTKNFKVGSLEFYQMKAKLENDPIRYLHCSY